ncbi:MAG TPA: regulatory protein RecX [Clostridiales bacterium]|jgi:SOS response regulatory protein OraA/RecX|nr:regulatory protein RecX [Clostridiales bacterium]
MEQTAFDAALSYLTKRDRTASEMRGWLRGRDFDKTAIDEAIERLIELGLLNDSAYGLRYAEYAAGRCRGPLRLSRELKDKGLSDEIIKDSVEQVFGSGQELELAEKQARRILRESAGREWFFRAGERPVDVSEAESGEEECRITPTDKELGRIARRLAAQGFRQSVIYDVLNRLRRDFI